MAKELSKEEQDELDVQDINQYKKEWQNMPKQEIEQELYNLDGYLDGVKRGEIDDIMSNINFMNDKRKALQEILKGKR